MKPVNAFPLIFKTHVPVNWEHISDKCENLITISSNRHDSIISPNGGTTLNSPVMPHEFPEFAELNSTIDNCIKELCEAWNLLYNDYTCVRSWINWHYQTGQLEEHDHSIVPFVATYYLRKPANSGNIEFRNPLEYHWCGYPTNQQIWQELPVEEGDLIFFPGWMKHRVQANQTTDRRLVLALNFNRTQ